MDCTDQIVPGIVPVPETVQFPVHWLADVQAALLAERASLLAERDALDAEHEERDALEEKLFSDVKCLRDLHEEQDARWDALEQQMISEIRCLGEQVREKDAERDALRSERDALRSERDALRSERDALRSERDALDYELDYERYALVSTASWEVVGLADTPQCTVCRSAPAEIAAVPCGHRFLCASGECRAQVDGHRHTRCYVCRAPRTGTLRVF
jgi:hypothetical protein